MQFSPYLAFYSSGLECLATRRLKQLSLMPFYALFCKFLDKLTYTLPSPLFYSSSIEVCPFPSRCPLCFFGLPLIFCSLSICSQSFSVCVLVFSPNLLLYILSVGFLSRVLTRMVIWIGSRLYSSTPRWTASRTLIRKLVELLQSYGLTILQIGLNTRSSDSAVCALLAWRTVEESY